MLSVSDMKTEVEEKLAAVGALLNLSMEPGISVPLTNVLWLQLYVYLIYLTLHLISTILPAKLFLKLYCGFRRLQ